ncbi:MAG: hypothetical protein QXT53_03400 [Ignisphaera sp.]
MDCNSKLQTMLVYAAISVLISSIILAVLQRYVASIISLLSGVILLSYASELCHEKE